MKLSGMQAKHPTRETTLSKLVDPAQATKPKKAVKAALYKFFCHLTRDEDLPVDRPKMAKLDKKYSALLFL